MTSLQILGKNNVHWRSNTRLTVYFLLLLGFINAVGASGDVPLCGSTNPNHNVIDQTEPENPGPFHDLTVAELRKIRTFLENDPNIRAAKSSEATVSSSYIAMADLLVPRKSDVLNFLDNGGPQPPRQAHVQMFRGDLNPPIVEEYACGPLPEVTRCDLIQFPNRRNPVEFSVRAFSNLEFQSIYETILHQVDEKLGHILRESYNATFTECTKFNDCFGFAPGNIGTNILGDINERRMWMFATYRVPFHMLHHTGFGVLCNLDGSDPTRWGVEKVWYADRLYNSMDEFVEAYESDSIPKLRLTKPQETDDLFSTLHRRGDPLPLNPQRPPLEVEPDGKRYSLVGRKVEYMGWSFNFRMSFINGPALYDIRYKGERIAYEAKMAELAVFYSGHSPLSQTTDYIDNGALIGFWSKSLLPGGDCPETSTLIKQTFLNQEGEEPLRLESSFCLFEHNNGYPLRRHLSFDRVSGSFYGGMLDSVLTLRSAMTIANYDYIVDFIFHQNGVIEARLMSTGYIAGDFYTDDSKPYSFRLENHLAGALHHHMAQFKVDLDVGGTSNRYSTLDFVRDAVPLAMDPSHTWHQTRYKNTLKTSELDALYHHNFDHPKYHVVYNQDQKTNFDEIKAYRIQMNGMSPNLYAPDVGNEVTVSWARQQLAVTRQRDEEEVPNYGMFDSANTVLDFSTFYKDNETIVDEDLVFWISMGLHHLPHTEDLPVTPTVGNHLSFFLLPYNYFRECPSMGSRDAMYIRYKDEEDRELGVSLNRNGQSTDQCITPRSTLEEDLEEHPHQVLID